MRTILVLMILFCVRSSFAFVVTKEGRADLRKTVTLAKETMPKRYAGLKRDMHTIRVSCAYLSSKGQTESPDERDLITTVSQADNPQLVRILRKNNRGLQLYRLVNDRKNRILAALPPPNSFAYRMAAAPGMGYVYNEPQRLHNNAVYTLEDLTQSVKYHHYEDCVQIVDEVMGAQI